MGRQRERAIGGRVVGATGSRPSPIPRGGRERGGTKGAGSTGRPRRPVVAIVVGTRPEIVKMAPVHRALARDPGIDVRLVTTGQHREMAHPMLALFDMRPDVDLDLMIPGEEPGQLAGRVLAGVQTALARMRPDAVLVQGDTTSCLYSALAAFYERIRVGHVEAGLRSNDMGAPWPEEMNRRLTDPIARWCFAPTERAAANLRAEGIAPERIHVTGNTIVDALLLAREKAGGLAPDVPGLPPAALEGRRLVLVTSHRRESFGTALRQVCLALRDIARAHPDVVLVYPVHMNPSVRRAVGGVLEGEERIHLVEPVEYLTFVRLMDRARLIVTDSGGIQEEAPSLGKPVLITRETTERPEAVEAGLAKIVGTRREAISAEARLALGQGCPAGEAAPRIPNPFGDGQAGERIAAILRAELSRDSGSARDSHRRARRLPPTR